MTSETDIINTILSSDKLQMDKVHQIKDRKSSIGEKSLLENLYLNSLHLGGDPMIGKTFHMHKFAPKEISILRKEMQSSIPSAFYHNRDQDIYNLMERLDTLPELDFLEELKQGMILFVQELQDDRG